MADYSIAFRLTLEDGTIVDEASKKEPLVFTIGDGSLAPCLEVCVQQLKKNEKQIFLLTPEYAFGYPNKDNEQIIKQSEFPKEIKQKEGAMVEFSTPIGQPMIGIINKIEGENIFVDFNHPLSGHNLSFEVEVL